MTEIVIVGGGIIGTSCAYHLRTGDHRVTVIERDEIGHATTAASMGVFSWQQLLPTELGQQLRRRSWSEYRALREAGRVEFTQTGALHVLEPGAALDELRTVAEELRSFGLKARVRRPEDLGPPLDTDSVGAALYTPKDGHVDPGTIARVYASEAEAEEVTIRTGTEVSGIRTERGRVTAVETTAGILDAEVVINAAGPWGPNVNSMVGEERPLRRTRGPIAKYERSNGPPFPFTLFENELYVRHAKNGIYVGCYDKMYRPDGDVTPAGEERPTEAFYEAVRDYLPDVLERPLPREPVEEWVGYRTVTPDGYPLVGPTGIDGFLLACGMNGLGITFAPAVGQLLSDWIERETGYQPLDRLAPSRFEGSGGSRMRG
jgi:sarcosine oxidase subunit beta